MKNFVKTAGGLMVLTMLLPIIILVVLIFVPAMFLGSFLDRLRNKRKLKKLIAANNHKIFFMYSDYNNYDFKEYFKNKHPNVHCAKIITYEHKDLLIEHLTKDCKGKSFPRLVKIMNDELVEKEHYNSLKHYYRKNNDMDSFTDLIEKSIKNLEAVS